MMEGQNPKQQKIPIYFRQFNVSLGENDVQKGNYYVKYCIKVNLGAL